MSGAFEVGRSRSTSPPLTLLGVRYLLASIRIILATDGSEIIARFSISAALKAGEDAFAGGVSAADGCY